MGKSIFVRYRRRTPVKESKQQLGYKLATEAALLAGSWRTARCRRCGIPHVDPDLHVSPSSVNAQSA